MIACTIAFRYRHKQVPHVQVPGFFRPWDQNDLLRRHQCTLSGGRIPVILVNYERKWIHKMELLCPIANGRALYLDGKGAVEPYSYCSSSIQYFREDYCYEPTPHNSRPDIHEYLHQMTCPGFKDIVRLIMGSIQGQNQLLAEWTQSSGVS